MFDCVSAEQVRELARKHARKPSAPVIPRSVIPQKPKKLNVFECILTLEDMNWRDNTPSCKLILETACEVLRVDVQDVIGHRRSRDYTEARKVVYWLLKTRTNKSFSQLGRFMNRDHSTICTVTQAMQPKIDKYMPAINKVEAVLYERLKG